MRVLGVSFAKKSEPKDSTPEFLAEVLRRNPQDETPHVTAVEGDEPALGVFAAIVATELASRRFNTLAQVSREYGCSQMKLIDAFKALQDGGLLESTDSASVRPGSFSKSKPSVKLTTLLKSQGFRLGAIEQLDAELFGKALAEFDVQIKKSLGVPLESDKLTEPSDAPLSKSLDAESFAALCSVLAQKSKSVPTVGLGKGIEVSPAAYILLHECGKGAERIKDIPAVARVYDIPAPTLYGAFERLVDAGMVTDARDSEDRSPEYATCGISENARQVLLSRSVATALDIVLFARETGAPAISRSTYSLLELTHAGLSLNSSVAAESLKTSRGSAARYLARMAESGLLNLRAGSTYDATTLAKKILVSKSYVETDSVEWLIDPEVKAKLDHIVKASESARDNSSIQSREDSALSASAAKKALADEEQSLALDRAIKSDVQRISNHLINLASKRNRQVFYSSELGFTPGKMSDDRLTDLSIRREAVRYLFDAGFLSFEEDFSDALANGIKPEEYQPAVKLHPLGDNPKADFGAFDRARDDYTAYRRQAYLGAMKTTSTAIAALCKENGFDEDDLKDFLNSAPEAALVSSTWAFDQVSGKLLPGAQLTNNTLMTRERLDTPALDFLSLNSPCSGRTLLQVLGLHSEDAVLCRESLRLLEKNGVVTSVIDESKYEATRYVLNAKPEGEIKQGIKRTHKDLKNYNPKSQAPCELLKALSEHGFVRVKDLYAGVVGFHTDSTIKPTEQDLDVLASTGALRRYRSKTGALDYLMMPIGIEGVSALTENAERCLMGLGGRLSKAEWSMPFVEFAEKVRKDGYQIPHEDSHAFNMAASVHSVPGLGYRKAVGISYGSSEKSIKLGIS